jgi:hypothetical protein
MHVFGQQFTSQTQRRGDEFQIDTATSSAARLAHVDRRPDGRFVVVWTQGDGSGDGAMARRYDAAGSALGLPFQVNTYTTGNQYAADVAYAADGSFVVVWDSNGQDGDGYGVFARRFDVGGGALGAEFQVNSYTTEAQYADDLAVAPDGTFVVSWMNDSYAGNRAVFIRRFTASGVPLGDDFRVDPMTTGDAEFSSIGMDERGNFVVAWDTRYLTSSGLVKGRRFDASGSPRGSEFNYGSGPFGTGQPDVVSDGVGNFLVPFFFDPPGPDWLEGQRFQGLVPAALAVDAAGNGVLEPGEAVGVVPSWTNITGAAQTFGGTAPTFTGPAGATYTLTDATAVYGTVNDGATSPCADCYGVSVSDPATRPATHWDAVLEEKITPDAQGQDKLWRVHVGNSFTDVPSAGGFYRFVETLLHNGITGGCGPTTYCPASATTREQMAVFVLVAREGSGYAPPACTTPVFNDVPAASGFCRWVEELARRGVVAGCGGGNYCPGDPVTREQMAIFVLRTLDPALSPPACAPPNLFADVPETSAFCRWIEELANRGIVTGCGGGNYCPGQPVTREQMGVFLTVTFGLTLYGV